MTEKQALKAVVRKSQEPIHVQIGEFFFLPSLFDAWKRADPDGTYCLDTITSHWKPGVEQFQRYYIAPSFSKHAWKHSKVKVFMSDASETATNWTSFNMSMMLATTLDGNNELVVLAIGLCDDCSELTWIWFLQNLMRDFKNIQVFLSNTDLITEGSNVPALLQLMNSVPSLCVTSLVNTLEHLHSTEFRDEEKELIEKMVKATTTQEYDVLRRALASHDRDAALWLDEHKKGFATFNFLGLPNCSRFGNVVSCANAMLNSTIQEVKDQPVSSMTTSLLMNISEAHFDRLKKARQRLEDGKQMTEYAEEKFNKIRDDGKTCRVQVIEHQGSDLWKAIVSQPHGEIIPFPTVIVKINTTLFTCECTCRLYDEMGILCVHGVAFLLQQNYDPEDLQWFHPRYHCQTLVEMYDSEPPDFSVFGKLAVEELLPPEHKLIGERKQRRKTPIVAPNNPHKCSACGEIGHHPKTCFNPSTQYRYQNFSEKSRKWAESACDLKVDGLFKT